MAKATPEQGSTSRDEAFGAAPHERPVPRISIHAFCEFPDTGAALQRASTDRRLSKAHVTVQLGGLQAAVEHYTGQVTPNLLIVETRLQGKTAVDEIDRLAEVCDPTTKVVIVGRVNDVELYRELMRRGVSEYLVAPLNPLHLIEVISGLYLGAEFGAHRPRRRVCRRARRRRIVDHRAQCRLVHRRRAAYQHDDRRSRSAVRHGRAQLQRRAEPGSRRRVDCAGAPGRRFARSPAAQIRRTSVAVHGAGHARARLRRRSARL